MKDGLTRGPRPIYVIWAIVALIGFWVLDFRPEWSSWFWGVSGLVGCAASWAFGYREVRPASDGSRSLAWQHALYWIGLYVAVLLVILAHERGLLSNQAMSPLILLLFAFGYYTAGIFLMPAFLWIGLVVAACYGVQVALGRFSWSVTGGVVALSLLVAAFSPRSRRPPPRTG